MTDVVVYGATAAGVCAAVAAAEMGADVTLLEPGRHLGGMVSGGLGYTDVGDIRALGGMARRLRYDVAAHYGVPVGTYAGPEPHVAEAILRTWLERAGVDVHFDSPLLGTSTSAAFSYDASILPARTVSDDVGGVLDAGEPSAVEISDSPERRITAIRAGGGRYEAAVFIDATYEGDLLALAGIPYAVGREDRSLHNETLAGRQELHPGMHNFPWGVSPFVNPAQPGKLLPQIKPESLVDVGVGDGGVMSYGYRVCLTQADDRLPFTPSPAWNPEHWELGRRLFAHWQQHGGAPPAGRLLGLEPNLPGGKCDANSLGPFSLSVLDGSAWRYPKADAAEREAIRLTHLHHAQDFLWFLSTDPAVPEHLRAELNTWGLPADEFGDTGHFPHQMYVREARRMQGAITLTQQHLQGAVAQDDVIALGSYHIDIREVQRTWRLAPEHPDPLPYVVTEGYLSVGVPIYPIPYRALIPRGEDCANLLVPVCLSASHVAFSSIRMEPQYQMLGEAAGRAAALAARSGVAVQALDVQQLQDHLTRNEAVLGAPR